MEQYNLDNRTELYNIAQAVPENEDVSVLISTMQKIMKEHNGIGLAAPQIGISKRVIIISTMGIQQVLINPGITRRRLGGTWSTEGCLSYPGMIKRIFRTKQIIVEGYDENWKLVKFKLRGLESNCIQHEIDHLNGITIKKKKQDGKISKK